MYENAARQVLHVAGDKKGEGEGRVRKRQEVVVSNWNDTK